MPRHDTAKYTLFQCKKCNKEFRVPNCELCIPGRGNFCSRDCLYAFGRVEKVCPGCSETFHVTKHRAEANPDNGTYCSMDCRSKANRVSLVCEICDKPFTETKSRVDDGKGRFCSYECRVEGGWRNPKIVVSPQERFWSHVDKTDSCWLWTGAKDDFGYGYFSSPYGVPCHTIKAHRFSWELANGPIMDGLCVLHNCPSGDNPSCVAPSHLFLGTRSEKSADMARKGRNKHLSQRKHSDANVVAIRTIYAAGETSMKKLAKDFKTSVVTIASIIHRKTFKHLP